MVAPLPFAVLAENGATVLAQNNALRTLAVALDQLALRSFRGSGSCITSSRIVGRSEKREDNPDNCTNSPASRPEVTQNDIRWWLRSECHAEKVSE